MDPCLSPGSTGLVVEPDPAIAGRSGHRRRANPMEPAGRIGAAHRVSPGGDGRIPQIPGEISPDVCEALVSGHHPRELWRHPSRSMWPSMSPPPSNQPQKDAHKGLKDQVKATSPNVPQVVGKSYLTGPNILPGHHDPDRGHTRRSTRRRCVRLNLPPPIPPGQRLHPRRRRTSPHSAGHDNVSACAHAGRILTPTRRPSVGSPSCAKHKCDQG